MKISRIASALGLVAGLLSASSAMAANQCVNCLYTAAGPTLLGALNPLNSDIADFRREGLAVNVATTVTDTWLFDIAPAGTFQLTASFNPFFGPTTRISNFSVVLRDVTASACVGTANSLGTSGSCGGIAFGALSVAGVPSFAGPSQSGAAVFPVSLLNPGRYAFQISYDLAVANGQESSYSGQVSMTRTVPEPGTLALAGLALVGMAAGLRRARKA